MRKNIIKGLGLLSVITVLLFTACEDLFIENDVDNKEKIDVSIYVYDVVSGLSLINAEVTMIVGGVEEAILTNDLGIAKFKKVKIATNVPVRVEKNNYVKINTFINLTTDTGGQSQYNTDIALYSLTQNMATIKGRLEIETDLTNYETEYVPEGTKIYAYLSTIVGSSTEFVAIVDSAGSYEFIVPASNDGISYDLKYSTLELDQKIAINRFKEKDFFQDYIPTIENINTLFNSEETAIDIPFVSPVYASVKNPTSSAGGSAIINDVILDDNGSVIDLDWLGLGFGYEADSVEVAVVSLFDGSGAVIWIEIDKNSSGTLQLSSMKIHNSGLGYPTFSNANKISSDSPSLQSYVLALKSGETRIVNGDYGTGVQRNRTDI